MAIVTQTNKRTGITYAYETQYHWDKEKKQSRSKLVCVGNETSAWETRPLYYGATYLFDKLAEENERCS